MQNNDSNDRTSVPPAKWRKAKVTASVLLAMVFSGFAVTPTVIMNSSYRDQMLNRSLNEKGLSITTESGSGSWLTATELTGIHITDPTGTIDVRIKSVITDKSLLSMLMNPSDLGLIIIDHPEIRVALNEEGKLPEGLSKKLYQDEASPDDSAEESRPDIAFEIQNAMVSLTVPWRKEPIVDVNDLDVSGQVATNAEGQQWLSVDRIQVFEHEALSDLHTRQNLALVAPVLSQTTELNGEVSLQIDPIYHQLNTDDNTRIPLTGHAILHSVRANLTQDWASQLSQFVGRTTQRGDQRGLEFVRDSRVDFAVIDEGIHHEGLAFILPQTLGQTQIASSGIVGFDETVAIDFRVLLPTPGFGGAFASSISRMLSGPIVMTVTGTVSEPKLAPPPGFGIADQLAENIRPGSSMQPAPPIKNSVMEIIGTSARGSADPAGDITGGILNIIRAARDARQNAEPESETEPELDGTRRLTPKERRELRRKRSI